MVVRKSFLERLEVWMLVNRDEGKRQSRLGYCAARRMWCSRPSPAPIVRPYKAHECDRVESLTLFIFLQIT